MWDPDSTPKSKNLLSVVENKQLPQEVSVVDEYHVFKFIFLNSSEVREAHGFYKKDGRIECKDFKWAETTCDLKKLEWIIKIVEEHNNSLV